MKTSFNVGDLIHRVFEGNYWLYEVLGYEAAYEMYRIHRLVNSYKPSSCGAIDFIDFNILGGKITLVGNTSVKY